MTGFRRAERLAGIELSEIVAISERASRLRAEGRDILSLSTGEPDLPTPPHVVEAAHRAARDGMTTYPPTAGIADLRSAIGALYEVPATRTVVSTGAKQVIANAMLATLDTGSEVIMPAPYWTSYSDIVRMCGGVPVVIACPMAQGFKLASLQLDAAITPHTRWLVLYSPSNPWGDFYAFPSVAGLLAETGGRFEDDAHLCTWLLDEAGVAVVPWRAFNLAGHLRLPFTDSEATIAKGNARMDRAMEGVAA